MKGVPTVLGIDPSTWCGWALVDEDGGRIASGNRNLAPREREGEREGARFMRLWHLLDELKREYLQVEPYGDTSLANEELLVAYELPGFLKTVSNYMALYGLCSHVESWCEREGLRFRSFAPAQVKIVAGCKGNAPKAEVCKAARARFDVLLYAQPFRRKGKPTIHDEFDGKPGEEDEADAIFIARAGWEWLRDG